MGKDWFMRKLAVQLLAVALYMMKSAWVITCIMGIRTRIFGASPGQKEFAHFLSKELSTLEVSGMKSCL